MPRPRALASYPTERPHTSVSPRKPASRRSADVVQARILATLALLGPLELREIRRCGWLAGPSSTDLCNAIAALVRSGLVEVSERSEITTSTDGLRHRRDFELFSACRPWQEDER